MSSFAKLAAIPLTAILLPLSPIAGSSSAMAQERCSGTLCDFYYGSSSSFDDKPAPKAPPTPVMVPRGTVLGMFSGASQPPAAPGAAPAAPAKPPLLGVGGGGIAALARGEKTEQCSGTLCDLYYGKSRSFDDPQEQPAAAAPVAQATAEALPEAPVETVPAQRGFETRPEAGALRIGRPRPMVVLPVERL